MSFENGLRLKVGTISRLGYAARDQLRPNGGAHLIDGLSVQHGERCLPQGDDFGAFLRDFVSWLPQIGLLFIKVRNASEHHRSRSRC
jgi:hypothetical protein